MNDKPILTKEYNIPLEMFANAFKDFQKKFVYPKNIVMTVVGGLIAIAYIYSLIQDPSNSVCIMIIIGCAFLISMTWLKPLMVRKNLLNSIDGIQEDRYIFELFDTKVGISTFDSPDARADISESQEVKEETEEDDFFKEIDEEEEIPKTIINFNMGGVKVLEKKDYFIIYIVRHMFYIVPKEHFSDEERAMLIKCFKNAQFIPEK